MAPSVIAFVRSCKVCAKNKDRTHALSGLLQPLEVPESRFHMWTVDFVTDLPLSQRYNAFITAVEKLIKYVVVMPCVLGDG